MKLTARLQIVFGAYLALTAGALAIAIGYADGAMRTALISVGAIVLVGGGLLAWRIVTGIQERIRDAVSNVRRIAKGDLTVNIAASSEDEIGDLQRALQQLNERLLKIIGTVRNGMVTVAGTCAQINRDNNIISRHTSAQATSLQQTAASMEELTATVKQNSDNAQEASRLAIGASQRASKGGEVVREAVQTMGSIEASSRKITDIVGVIDSIAFQTNILALNAAVEAARAGEQGRGFAVVASEVRSLAQRSATAAKEIKALINDSVAQVTAGSRLVAAAGQTMEDIVNSIGSVANIVNSISEASREQSMGIESVNQAVTELDGIAAKNSKLMQEAGVTAKSLNGKTVAVLKAVEEFNLGSREYGTREEAFAMVKRAVEFARTHGIHALMDEVNKTTESQFVDRDMYLFVLDLDTANWAAHGNNPRAIGMGNETKDVVTGRYFVREMAQLMKTQGAGWIDYHWQHAITNEHQAKSAYMERFENYGIGCGIYKRDGEWPSQPHASRATGALSNFIKPAGDALSRE